MHICKINNYQISYPENWDELNQKQLLTIVRGFLLGLTDIEFRVKTILVFLKLKVAKRTPTYRSPEILHYLKPKAGKPMWVSSLQLTELANSIGFLTSSGNSKQGINTLNSKLTNNLIPSFYYRFHSYYGPDNRLFNLLFEEYLEADSHFLAFTSSNNIADIDRLIASLYRPSNKQFDSDLVTKQALKLRKLNPETKFGILLFYQGCRNFLAEKFPHVFSATSKGSGSKYGSLDLIDSLTGDDVTKNKAVRVSLLYNVMVRLERAAILHEQMTAKLQNK